MAGHTKITGGDKIKTHALRKKVKMEQGRDRKEGKRWQQLTCRTQKERKKERLR